jgi:DNA-binding LytR/AlgR family response regulator
VLPRTHSSALFGHGAPAERSLLPIGTPRNRVFVHVARGKHAEAGGSRALRARWNGREIFLPVAQLDWAEAVRNNVVLHTGRETYTIRGTLETLARELDPDHFARISRSAIVNLDRVKEMQPWFHGERRTILKDGTEITWTRRFRAASSRQ